MRIFSNSRQYQEQMEGKQRLGIICRLCTKLHLVALKLRMKVKVKLCITTYDTIMQNRVSLRLTWTFLI